MRAGSSTSPSRTTPSTTSCARCRSTGARPRSSSMARPPPRGLDGPPVAQASEEDEPDDFEVTITPDTRQVVYLTGEDVAALQELSRVSLAGGPRVVTHRSSVRRPGSIKLNGALLPFRD